MKPISSVITGLPNLAPGASSLTGPQRGVAGLGDPQEARTWLSGQKPDIVDAKLRTSLLKSFGVDVNANREWRFPEGKPAYQVATKAGLKGLSTESCPAALARVEAAFTPVTVEQAEQMVAQMDAVLSRRNKSESAISDVLDVFVNVLLSHPADVAVEAVRHFTVEPRKDGGTAWFPTPPELESHCRLLSEDRLALRTALRSWKPTDPAQDECDRLELAYRRLRMEASKLETKIGPGPALDTGARGERIEAARVAGEKARAAKQDWLEAQKALDAA